MQLARSTVWLSYQAFEKVSLPQNKEAVRKCLRLLSEVLELNHVSGTGSMSAVSGPLVGVNRLASLPCQRSRRMRVEGGTIRVRGIR